MPFRLLGMVADPDQASALGGLTFARYAASGVDITLACASTGDWTRARLDPLRSAGVRGVVLLDYEEDGLRSADLEPIFADVMASLRPHVVIADGGHTEIARAAVGAFHRTRRGGGSSSLPAKLYYGSTALAPVALTTRIAVSSGPVEHFVRVWPSPWVTGLLETDLFAGIRDAVADPREQRLAG